MLLGGSLRVARVAEHVELDVLAARRRELARRCDRILRARGPRADARVACAVTRHPARAPWRVGAADPEDPRATAGWPRARCRRAPWPGCTARPSCPAASGQTATPG